MGSNPAGRAIVSSIAYDVIMEIQNFHSQILVLFKNGQVAQSVEQRTENPCVGGSIPPLATIKNKHLENYSISAFLFCVLSPK